MLVLFIRFCLILFVYVCYRFICFAIVFFTIVSDRFCFGLFVLFLYFYVCSFSSCLLTFVFVRFVCCQPEVPGDYYQNV